MIRNTQGVVSNFTKKVHYFEVYNQYQDAAKFALVKQFFFSQFYPEKDRVSILILHSNQHISYYKKKYPHFFAILPSKYNTSLKNIILFLNILLPSKFIYKCVCSVNL